MKRISRLLFAGVLMSALCVAFVACNEPNEPKENDETSKSGTLPIADIPDEVTVFFDENVDLIAKAIFEKDGNLEVTDRCVMINSVEGLPKTNYDDTPFEFEYPAVDFDTYTLVVGQWSQGHVSLYLASQSFVIEDNIATMNLIIGVKEGIYTDEYVPYPAFFWGLYPKIDSKTIETNVTLEN